VENLNIKGMTRTELEDFAHKAHNDCMAAKASIRRLDEEMAQVDGLLRNTAPIDPDIVEGWRQWIGKLQEEIEIWAKLATDKSAENQRLKATEQERYGRLRDDLGQAYETLDVLVGALGKIRGHCEGQNDEKRLTVMRESFEHIDRIAETALVAAKEYTADDDGDNGVDDETDEQQDAPS
jgi:hypothetical protein